MSAEIEMGRKAIGVLALLLQAIVLDYKISLSHAASASKALSASSASPPDPAAPQPNCICPSDHPKLTAKTYCAKELNAARSKNGCVPLQVYNCIQPDEPSYFWKSCDQGDSCEPRKACSKANPDCDKSKFRDCVKPLSKAK